MSFNSMHNDYLDPDRHLGGGGAADEEASGRICGVDFDEAYYLGNEDQVWIVEATETFGPEGDGRDNRTFLWAFPDRETAHKVYAEGERTVRSMSWRLTQILRPVGLVF